MWINHIVSRFFSEFLEIVRAKLIRAEKLSTIGPHLHFLRKFCTMKQPQEGDLGGVYGHGQNRINRCPLG